MVAVQADGWNHPAAADGFGVGIIFGKGRSLPGTLKRSQQVWHLKAWMVDSENRKPCNGAFSAYFQGVFVVTLDPTGSSVHELFKGCFIRDLKSGVKLSDLHLGYQKVTNGRSWLRSIEK